MEKQINTKQIEKAAGVYVFVNEDGNVIYVGSSNNIRHRLEQHKHCIKNGSNNGSQIDFYEFLKNNPFTVETYITPNYKEKEQELIEEHLPIFNKRRANTGITNKESYLKEWQQKYHKEFIDYKNNYNNQLCNYKNKILTLNALTQRFFKEGLEHPTAEAKKYLIKEV